MTERPRNQEREQRLNEVFESLLKGRQAERAEQQEGGPEWLEQRVSDLPDTAKAQIREYDRKLVEAGVANPAKRAELAEEKIVAFEQTYQDRRFTVGEGEHMLNKAYAKEQVVSELKGLLGDSPTKEDLKKIALLNFDANGLKAVNDLSGSHEKGTEYLKRIADVFADQNSVEAKRMKELGIDDILAVTAGGDEYSLRLKSDKPIPPEAIEEALRMYEAAIQRIDVSDLVDFNDEATILRYIGVSEQQYGLMKEEDRQKLLSDAREVEIPEGFAMRASAAGGGATLYEGLLMAMEHPSKPLTEDDDFHRAIDKIVGGVWDAADKAALENKNVFKEGLREEKASKEDRFYSKVLARTSEARLLEAKLDAMTMELKRGNAMHSELADLDYLMRTEQIDWAAYGKASYEIRKKYQDAL